MSLLATSCILNDARHATHIPVLHLLAFRVLDTISYVDRYPHTLPLLILFFLDRSTTSATSSYPRYHLLPSLSISHTLDTPSKMFIGGLSWDTTDGILFLHTLFYVALIISVSPIAQTEGLKNYFSEFGKVLPLRR